MTQLNNWIHPNPYLHEITISKEMTDKLGHTNNVRYVEFLENIAWDHIESLGCGWDVKEKIGKAMAITRTEIDYVNASYLDDCLHVATWVIASDQRFTCSRQFQIIRASDKKTILNAKMNFACISLKTGRLSKMPEIFVKALDQGLQVIQ